MTPTAGKSAVPSDILPGTQGDCQLEIATRTDEASRASGIGWLLLTPTEIRPARAATRPRGRTVVSNELVAVRKGLEEARRAGCRRLEVRVPGPTTLRLLSGEGLPRFRRAARQARSLIPLLTGFDAVRFVPLASPDAALRHAVARAMRVGVRRAAEHEERRRLLIEGVMARAPTVRLEQGEVGWIANERYAVQLDPMRCTCPAWSARWSKVSLPARRAQRLPCKHLVALALRQGIDSAVELSGMARKAIE